MIFLKSFVAGILALLAYVLLIAVALWLRTRATSGGVIVGPGWLFLTGALLIFGAAFYWAFSRNRQ